MKKITLLIIASIMMLCLASCDKDVISKKEGLTTEDVISFYGEDKDVLLSRMKEYSAVEVEDGRLTFASDNGYIEVFGYSDNVLWVDFINNSVSEVVVVNSKKYQSSIYNKVTDDLKRLYPNYKHEESGVYGMDIYNVTGDDIEIYLAFSQITSSDIFTMKVNGTDNSQ